MFIKIVRKQPNQYQTFLQCPVLSKIFINKSCIRKLITCKLLIFDCTSIQKEMIFIKAINWKGTFQDIHLYVHICMYDFEFVEVVWYIQRWRHRKIINAIPYFPLPKFDSYLLITFFEREKVRKQSNVQAKFVLVLDKKSEVFSCQSATPNAKHLTEIILIISSVNMCFYLVYCFWPCRHRKCYRGFSTYCYGQFQSINRSGTAEVRMLFLAALPTEFKP